MRTEGIVPEFLGKTPTEARQVTGSTMAHPRPHQRAYPSYNREGMVCKVSVKNNFDIIGLFDLFWQNNDDITLPSILPLSTELIK